MYGLESLDFTESMLCSLDSPFYQAMAKIFKTFDKNILNSCLFYSNSWPLRYEYFNRKINFLSRLNCINNIMINFLYFKFGSHELANFRKTFDISSTNRDVIKFCIWKQFSIKL